MSRALSIMTTVLLSLVIIVELFIGARIVMVRPLNKQIDDLSETMTGTQLNTWDDVEYVEEIEPLLKGDVVRIYNYNFRVPGTLMEVPASNAGKFSYMYEDGSTHEVTYNTATNVSDVMEELTDYFLGDVTGIGIFLPVSTQSDNLEPYMQTTPEGAIAIIYNYGDNKYYTIVPMTDIWVCIASEDILSMTEDTETVIFGNPSDDPMTYHTYNMYEITAIENTRNALSDGSYVGSADESLPTAVAGTSSTYTSEADNATRKSMLDYANITWRKDGTSNLTSLTIDTTSPTAKASEWVLTSSSPYAFTDNSLKLHSLRATRNTDTFALEAKITNQLPSERPYVVVIKFLNSDGELLYVGVVDKRLEPIAPNDIAEWQYVLTGDSNVDLLDIYALQFEIY